VPNAPEMPSPADLNTDPRETGDPLNFAGRVYAADGSPADGAVVDVWHADADGRYSNIHPDVPEWKFRARVTTDAEGRFSIDTIVPPPYEIPKEGPTGALLRAAGWHAFRPAHLHVRVSAPGHEPLTTQLYFEGDPYLDSDVADAVKPDVVVRLDKREDGDRVSYSTSYDFKLFPPVDLTSS
jgi:catechol 1,2-dioxygenase